ncbi:hypothetical protein QTP88_015295 [Uroleucon formosanum]
MAPVKMPSNPTNYTDYKRTASIAFLPREYIKNKFLPLLDLNSTNPPVLSNINKQSYAEITKTNTHEHRQPPPSQPNIQSELLQLLMPTINSLLPEIIKKVIE